MREAMRKFDDCGFCGADRCALSFIGRRWRDYERDGRSHGQTVTGVNCRLVFAVVAGAGWSAFQHGYNTGVLNTPQHVMSRWLQEEALPNSNRSLPALEDPAVAAVWSVAVAIYCVGGMLGGMLTGLVADRFGRKGGLLLNNLLVFAGAACQGAARSAGSAHLLVVGRLLVGVNSGLNAGLAPLYLAEIAPTALRGSIGTVYQLVITVSILLAQVLGLQWALGSADGWPWLLALPAAAAALQCATLPFAVESPKYLLLTRGQELHAQRALSWLRGDVAVHAEMEEMHQEAKSKVSKKVTLRELFSARHLRQPMLIAIVVMMAQQLSGINAVIFYSTDIFRKAHLSDQAAQYASLGMGGMNVLMTVVSLGVVERAGRRALLLGGLAGMLLCTLALTGATRYSQIEWVSYVCVALVILFVSMFALGPGAIPWFLVTELFGQAARPAATAVAVAVNWLANFIVGLSFLPLSLVLHTNVFLIFAALQLLFIVFLRAKLPETRNKTTDEIQAMFRQHL